MMKKNSCKRKRKHSDILFFALFSVPSVLLYVVFLIVPLGLVIWLSLTRWTGAGDIRFIGFDNYSFLFSYSDFWIIIRNTAIMVLMNVAIQIPLATILAFVLFRLTRGFRFFRATYFLPSIISATVIGLMFSVLLNSDIGPVNSLLRSMGLNSLALNWLSNPRISIYTVTVVSLWQYIGYHMVLILAGMQSISEEIMESAMIDGANNFQLAIHIVLPQIRPVLEVSFIFCVTGCLKGFEHAFIMTWGGPGVASTNLALYMYKLAFSSSELGKGAAIAVMIVVSALVLTRLTNFIFRGKGEEDALSS